MKLSSRTRYGIRAMLELAFEYGKKPLQIKSIADRENISNKYLEQLIAMLKSAGLVRSVRGPRGGYMLAKPPQEISLKDIFVTLEGPITPVDCLKHSEFTPNCTDCATRQIWNEIQDAISNVLSSKTLRDLLEQTGQEQGTKTFQN
ncbi:MAG TPA: Rrf2 family transcriptional regulator [Anaerohalosphaeraceae bacterium]|nr:Rrf2 family transcriptional regulator [Phycisphaerae bacterium]HOM60986.1 Rrf2 family transcriptional regulator [Anaerohalosphaeraceae bacterium]HOT72585.1 Rrf2 family transcriptional regulator [Anaerohalosphaeraceae bacterium]HPB93013.1 Rrf2 family transcriptional regulator [Anaerohalosphaeraceae bacterium]HQG05762.1 Rrf2 family transcriptional regulator [Anaerohalosphaeraceae bacterium]